MKKEPLLTIQYNLDIDSLLVEMSNVGEIPRTSIEPWLYHYEGHEKWYLRLTHPGRRPQKNLDVCLSKLTAYNIPITIDRESFRPFNENYAEFDKHLTNEQMLDIVFSANFYKGRTIYQKHTGYFKNGDYYVVDEITKMTYKVKRENLTVFMERRAKEISQRIC